MNIRACLARVVSQACVAEVLVYDDDSSDGTADIVQQFASQDARVRVATTEALPPGWSGKTFACARLAAQARSDWLLFLDADVRLAPGAVSSIVSEAHARSATFVSCWPGLDMHTFFEKLLMPLLNFVVFTFYPAPLAFRRRDPALGLAHGACILVERNAYESIGGHAAVGGEIFEDTQLARLWRERGERSVCLDGQDVVRVRMYSSVVEIWAGFQKNFRAAFRSPLSFWAFIAAHALLFLAPFLIASPAALLVIAVRLLLAWRFRHPFWSALLHPFAEAFLLALGLSSWWMCRSGRGVVWKGRRYQHT